MAEYRTLRMSFWNDPYIEAADPLRKLIYLYLITCPHTNNLGVLEVSSRRIGFEVGAQPDDVERCLNELADHGKIHRDGCVIWLVHFIKHQTSTSAKIVQGLRGLLSGVSSVTIRSVIASSYPKIFAAAQAQNGSTPHGAKADTVSNGYGYPMDTLSIPIAEEEEEREKEDSLSTPLTPHADSIPPEEQQSRMPSMEWQELREHYSRVVRPEGPMDGYIEFCAAKGSRTMPSPSAMYDAVERWIRSGRWVGDNSPTQFAPGLGKFIERKLWSTNPQPAQPRQREGPRAASAQPRASTVAQARAAERDLRNREYLKRNGVHHVSTTGQRADDPGCIDVAVDPVSGGKLLEC